ncbi:hypothetical protein L5515_015704 [Caenorhabditis briggsae]|uniref:Uncharacterized protein n=1 Tax=Caenorhabditis briggsae TaxID=6238 RepID=A0AAE9J8G6_CAEBR|nr:hypothetical protein L5515_015704 [Caenorhabditis briggsae]
MTFFWMEVFNFLLIFLKIKCNKLLLILNPTFNHIQIKGLAVERHSKSEAFHDNRMSMKTSISKDDPTDDMISEDVDMDDEMPDELVHG